LHSKFVFGEQRPGGPYTESKEFVFAGSVYLYTDNPLTPIQIGDLMKWYQQKGLSLQIRGLDYLTFHESVPAAAAQNIQEQQVKALQVIQETAESICYTVKQEGQQSNKELSGRVRGN
jgi:hypothetical protein